MLDEGELDRRLKAIRTLRQISQKQLGEMLLDEGLNKMDIGFVERGYKPLRNAMRRALADILKAPEAYFTEPDLDAVLFRAHVDAARQARLVAELERELEEARQVLRAHGLANTDG